MRSVRPGPAPAEAGGPASAEAGGPGWLARGRQLGTGRTGRGDTALAFAAAALAVALVMFGLCAVTLGRWHVEKARRQLAHALFAAAVAEHRSPRDPSLLPTVASHLRQGVMLTPTRDFRATGAMIIRWRRLNGRTGTVCVVVPARVGGRITDCPDHLPRSTRDRVRPH